MNSVLVCFIRLRRVIVLLVNGIAVAGMFMTDGFIGGLTRIQDTYSPYNLINCVIKILFLAPALIAAWWLAMHRKVSNEA